jgi:acetolactate synthase-1/2/3 large subunit
VIFAGKGVHNAFAHDELRELAERWGAAVVTTYKGKSAIEETHSLAAGMAGTYGRFLANRILQEADVVVVVGAKLATSDTAGESLLDPAKQTLIQVDIEPKHIGWVFPPDEGLVGDAKLVLRALVEASGAPGAAVATTRSNTEAAIAQFRSEDPVELDDSVNIDSAPVLPQRLVRLLEENLLPNTNLSLDAGYNRIWVGLFLKSQSTHSFFAPGGMAGMGWALPAALAIKLARPNEPSVAIAGDGGVMMSITALATAVEANIPVVCVVMNDSQLGMVAHHQADRAVASIFGDTDYAAIARGFGADGIRVEDSRDLPKAIIDAQASGRPTLIDVVIDKTPNPDVFRARARAITET